ncbi:MAG: DUF308 domain-containing protein [Caldilineales bacterium]|nr:DUF308 domain-containing protein [Caldilineales bacterium]MDW8316373.1 DUF308 domain-containing protein [Anaerolineae bacterium]
MAAAEAFASPKPLKWWVPLVQGIVAIIVGVLFLTEPGRTAKIAVFALGVYWLVLGVLDLLGLFRDRTAWGWKLFSGIIGILAGGLIVNGFLGGATALDRLLTTVMVGMALATVIGVLGLIYGILLLISGFRGGGAGAIIIGVITVILALIILFRPLATALALPLVIGIWLIIGGIISVILAFSLRGAQA